MERLLTETEAARMIGCHPGTLSNWRYRGYGPPCTRGLVRGREVIRYPEKQLKDWAKENWGALQRPDNKPQAKT